jgi:hypothetical protein
MCLILHLLVYIWMKSLVRYICRNFFCLHRWPRNFLPSHQLTVYHDCR